MNNEYIVFKNCPDCQSTSKVLSNIYESNFFANQKVNSPSKKLYQCQGCGLIWKSPQPNKALLKSLYETGSDSCLLKEAPRPFRHDWTHACAFIEEFKNINILDYGSGTGEFVKKIHHIKNKYAYDPGNIHTKDSGLNWISEAELSSKNRQFQIITAFDVIEHFSSPNEFFNEICSLLEINGYLILSTGNTNHWSSKWLKGKHWYVQFQEHLCFYSDNWFRNHSEKSGFELIKSIRFSTAKFKTTLFIRQFISNLSAWLFPCFLSVVRNLQEKEILSPSFNTNKDQIFIVLKKVLRKQKND